jgi:AcrR family transcriptional regulator
MFLFYPGEQAMRTRSGDKHRDILDAATKVFARDGFDGARITAIADMADIATGSVYLYFQGKEAILDTLFCEFWERLLAEMRMIEPGDPFGRIRLQLGIFIEALSRDRDLCRVYLRDHHRFIARRPEGFLAYQQCVDLGDNFFRAASGSRVEGERFALSHAILFGEVRAALEYWLSSSDLPLEAIKEHTLTMAMAGLAALAEEET